MNWALHDPHEQVTRTREARGSSVNGGSMHFFERAGCCRVFREFVVRRHGTQGCCNVAISQRGQFVRAQPPGWFYTLAVDQRIIVPEYRHPESEHQNNAGTLLFGVNGMLVCRM